MATARGKKDRKYDLEERAISFAVRVINVVEALPRTRVGNHVAGQLLRCGTAPASHYGEAQSAESRNGVVHKMKMGLKELYTFKWNRSFDTGSIWTAAGGVRPGDWPQWMKEFKDYY